ncbi:hypothetical protein JW905_06910 [bacterium]|nr:hypothetical protein [candidate division CSSED10-310 bacterium]
MERFLDFILNEQNVAMLLWWLAVVTPAIGIIIGGALGIMTRALRFYGAWGLVLGLIGPLLLGLWKLYNAITNVLGLDTVKNLLVNLAVFIVIGIVLGIALSFLPRRTATTPKT